MKKLSIIFSLLLLTNFTRSQVSDSKSFIEVNGSSIMEVVPDQIFITITLLERMDGKEKISIDKQEADLKKNLKEIGIDLNNLSLNSANADYEKVRRSTKDVLVSKSYVLKVGGTDLLSKVYERLDKIDVNDAYVSNFSHSKIEELQKENRIKAIKAAKEKVDYILAAVGEQAGAPIQISEQDNYIEQQPIMQRSSLKNMQMASNLRMEAEPEAEMSFKKIKIRSGFLVKYEIIKK